MAPPHRTCCSAGQDGRERLAVLVFGDPEHREVKRASSAGPATIAIRTRTAAEGPALPHGPSADDPEPEKFVAWRIMTERVATSASSAPITP
jgi:hypothetical protein